MKKEHQQSKGRSSRSAINALIFVGSVLGILILVNIISYTTFSRLDLTEDKIHTLSNASKNLVKGLDKPLVIKAYFSEDLQPPYHTLKQRINDLLDEYRAFAGPNLKIEIRTPGMEDDVTDEASGFGIYPTPMQFTGRTAIEVKNVYAGVAFLYEDRQEVLGHVKPWDNLEYEFTNAIKKVTSDAGKKVLGFLSGHGELVDMQGVLDALGRRELLGDLYDVRSVKVDDGSPIPDDIDALVVLNPSQMVGERAQFEIDQYLMKGNPVAFLFSTYAQDRRFPMPRANPVVTGLEGMLQSYGIDVKRELILDRVHSTQMLIQTQEGMMIANYPVAIVTRDLASDNIIVKDLGALALPFSSPIEVKDELKEQEGIQISELIKSSTESKATSKVQDLAPEKLLEAQPDERDGPFTIAVSAIGNFNSAFHDKDIPPANAQMGQPGILNPADLDREKLDRSARTRLFVMANGEFLVQQNRLQRSSINFLQNLVDWLAADEDLISIRSKDRVRMLEPVEPSKQDLIKYGNIVALPLGFIFIGLIRFGIRKRKRKTLWDDAEPTPAASTPEPEDDGNGQAKEG